MDRKNIYYWLLLPVLALMMGACGELNNDEELSNPDTPVTPVNPGDWQTVPAKGGTIEKGDIALTFPAGTFDADTKVAITEVKKGSVGGECEVSSFYQLTVSNATNKPITVKMKAKKEVSGAEFVVRTPGCAVSLGEEILCDQTIPATSAGGNEYTGTFPAFDASDSKESTSFTIGLMQIPDGNAVAAREITRADDSVIGKDRKVSWELKIKYWKGETNQISESVIKHYDEIKEALPVVNIYIKEAVKIIQDLGFKIPDGVKLNYYIGDADYYYVNDKYSPDITGITGIVTGLFKTSPNGYYDRSYYARCFDAIYLQGSLALTTDHKVLKQTIIHETLHNFQSYYNMHKYYRPTGEHRSMYEIGSVWVEKFMDNGVSVNQFMNKGELNGQWLMLEQGLFDTFKNQFRLGLSTSSSDVKAIYGDYDSQGYSLGPLLYYMVSKNYSRGFDDTTVATLYDPFWGRINSSGYSLLEVLNEWYNVTFKENFFDGTDNINNYYLALWKGELMKHFNINNIEGALDDLKIKINQLNENNLNSATLL